MLSCDGMSSQRVVSRARTLLRIRQIRANQRGFSLVELMAVVAIVGILAALGVAAISRRASQSNVAGATTVIKLIGAAQGQYMAQNQVYLNVSTGPNAWYPRADIRANQVASFWRAGSDADTTNWRRLAPDVREPVQFGFLANAGLPNVLPSSFLSTDFVGKVELPPGAGTSNEAWFLTQARADADGDNIPCGLVGVSWSPQILSFNDGE